MSSVPHCFKRRCRDVALCLTAASAMFVVLDSVAGAAVTPPAVMTLSNHHAPITGGTAITITGTGFESGARVLVGQGHGPNFGAIPMNNVTVVSSTEITAVAGRGGQPGVWGLFVVNPDGGVNPSVFASLFAYDPLPTIARVTPHSGPVSGGTAITITGTGFVKGATVSIAQGNGAASGAGFGAIAATNVVVVSSSEITAVTGGGAAAGTFSAYVVDPDGGNSVPSVASLFTYS